MHCGRSGQSVTPEEWQRVTSILHDALAREPADRAAFLDETCGEDDAVRAEVERLLAAHHAAGSFGNVPLHDLPALPSSESDATSTGIEAILAPMDDLLTRLQEYLADRYRVEREIGRGGMAIVYLAHDVKHHRRVAIKVLRPELVPALGTDRFVREIEIAAQLTHPNILPLHDSGEAHGLLYYVMPYLEGESLRDRLGRDRQLQLDEAVQISQEVADALGYAHSLGLVHRDIKPENILFTAGHPMVSDFGIARVVAAAGGKHLTQTGIPVGTPAYMSPEQAAGERELDGRSDLYSLACVTYELLAGQPPFTGASAQAVMARHSLDPVPRLRTLRPTVPEALEHALEKALAKVPADRFATAREFADELARAATAAQAGQPAGIGRPGRARWRTRARLLAGVAGAVALIAAGSWYALLGRSDALDQHRVSVAPFADRTGDARLAELGDLAADWITRRVSQSKTFSVTAATVARETWLAAQVTPGRVRTLAERTGAGVIVTGSFTVDGHRVRFATEIIDARTGSLVTDLEPVEASVDSATQVIATLAERVAGALVAQLGPQLTRPGGSNPPSLAAFREYQMGLDVFSRGDWEQSIAHFKRAMAIDSSYPPPVLWAAMAYRNSQLLGPADTLLMSISGLLHQLTPLEQVTFEWLSANNRSDRAEGLRRAEQAFHLSPRDWAYPYGLALLNSNRPRRALEMFRRYDRETPFGRNWIGYWQQSGNAHHLLGQYRAELNLARQWRGANAPQLSDLSIELRALAAQGRLVEVEQLLERALSLPPHGQGRARRSPAIVAVGTAQELRAHGHRETANAVLDRTIAQFRSRAIDADAYLLGRALYMRERWAEARAVFDSLQRSRPADINYLGYLGATYARLGDRPAAAMVDSQLADVKQAYLRGSHTRWRAQIAALLGDGARAVQLLIQAEREGLNLGIELHAEPDFEPLRDYAPFQAFIRPKG
jgi:tetratricopeptide (TPR) repeat protein/TolB-like protein/tRNA A-37 threonylcarbamoyl transferase component Bud32